MTPMLRWLIWAAALVGMLSLILGWSDEIEALRPERARVEQLRQREENAMRGLDWRELAKRSRQAQLAWLERLPEVDQPGVYRAEAMESMADLCKRLDAACKVSALGEGAEIPAVQASGTQAATVVKGRSGAALAGLVSTSVRVSVGLPGNKLLPLLREIEDGPVLRRVEKLSVRSGRADFVVKSYGLNASAAADVRRKVPVLTGGSVPGNVAAKSEVKP